MKVVRIASAEWEPTEDILPFTLNSLAKAERERCARCRPMDMPTLRQRLAKHESLLTEFRRARKEGLSSYCMELITEFDKQHPNAVKLDDKIAILNENCEAIKRDMSSLRLDTVANRKGQRIFEETVLENAEVVCTTLSTSGIELLSGCKFDYLIVDEACQVRSNTHACSAQN